MLFYYTSSLNEEGKKDSLNINDSYDYENKYKFTEDDKKNSQITTTTQLNNYNFHETKNIKNNKKDAVTNKNSNYDNLAYIESNHEEFKPYVSEKVFKKRGLAFKHYKNKPKDDNSNKKESDKKESKNKNIININNNKNNNLVNYTKKYNIGDDILKRINDNNKYSSYYGDSSNNVYYEIKHLNDSDKKAGNINNSNITKKKGARTNLGNYNSFGVQSEALYIPNKDN